MDTQVVAPLFNFAVVLFVLGFFGRKAFADGLKTRSQTLAQAIRGAEAEAAEADKVLSHWETRWKASEAEAKQNRDDARTRMEGLKASTLAAAQKSAERIVHEARLIGQSEASKGKETLQKDVVRRSVAMAKEYLTAHLSDKERSKLVGEYVELMGNGTTK